MRTAELCMRESGSAIIFDAMSVAAGLTLEPTLRSDSKLLPYNIQHQSSIDHIICSIRQALCFCSVYYFYPRLYAVFCLWVFLIERGSDKLELAQIGPTRIPAETMELVAYRTTDQGIAATTPTTSVQMSCA